MPNDPFVIIGVDHDASQQEILEAYKAKRQALSDKLFAEGEEGADAAHGIEELDRAYQLAMDLRQNAAKVEDDAQNFSDVKDAIKNKDIDRAQRFLDSMEYRGGEWHYYQAIVFYEKHWLSESKKQLEIALELEPENTKYRRALDNLKKKSASEPNPNNAQQAEQSQRSYGNGAGSYNRPNRTYSQQDDAGKSICDACAALWCADCCCECMGGDLISCC